MPTALLLATVQFVFALTWTVYVFFLPALAQQAGIAKSVVWLILLLDQVVFALCDAACGAWLDRVRPALPRLLRVMLGLTLISSLGFLALPWLAPSGNSLAMALLLFVWALTSAALRVPPMLMLARFFPADAFPRMASLSMLGLAVAGAFSPLLTLWLAGQDPRWPFALASIGLTVSVAVLLRCEGVSQTSAMQPTGLSGLSLGGQTRASGNVMPWHWIAAVALLALGFQLHTFVNSAPAYLRLVSKDSLPMVMPAFWLGFGLCMWAWSRFGFDAKLSKPAPAVAALSVAGALVWVAIASANQIGAMLILQGLGGVVWAAIFNLALACYAEQGRTGGEGRSLGWFFCLLAVAALVRIGLTGSGVASVAEVKPVLPWLPSLCFVLALAILAGRSRS